MEAGGIGKPGIWRRGQRLFLGVGRQYVSDGARYRKPSRPYMHLQRMLQTNQARLPKPLWPASGKSKNLAGHGHRTLSSSIVKGRRRFHAMCTSEAVGSGEAGG